jgi:SOS response regulatory protein OraA/RecX
MLSEEQIAARPDHSFGLLKTQCEGLLACGVAAALTHSEKPHKRANVGSDHHKLAYRGFSQEVAVRLIRQAS